MAYQRALTSTSVRYWGLAPLPTADHPFDWALSWLTIGGVILDFLGPSLFEKEDLLLQIF